MYKDFKKSQTLDTGFTSGSSLLWMFSGIVLGLLVGLGMYLFSNDKIHSISMIDSLEKKIQKAQTNNKPLNTDPSQTAQPKQISSNKPQEKIKTEKVEERKNKFSYYAVLPNLDVPVNSAKPINTSTEAQNVAVPITAENIIDDTNLIENIEPIEEIVEAPELGDYLLQVASFKKESMADKTRGRLTNQGIDAYIQKKKIKGRYWYRVVAGPVDQSSVDNWKVAAEQLGHKPLVISIR